MNVCRMNTYRLFFMVDNMHGPGFTMDIRAHDYSDADMIAERIATALGMTFTYSDRVSP